jgi:adenine-specific DNA-methyltransferase
MSEVLATSPATPAFQKLVAKLREVFQIDQPDLDFGIYRIINARAAEIGDYLENKLRAKVDAALASGQQAGLEDLKRDLAAAEQQARDLGADPASLPKVKDLRARVAALSGGAAEHRDAVFSHLLTFFSRYYDRGDFISQRRYKGDTYAIPYSGEEVVLHWANKDQYYTKSGENFTNYTFALADGRRVHFRLAAADTAKDDRKDTDVERRFRLIEPRTVTRRGDDGEAVQEQQVPIVEVPAQAAGDGRPATSAELILWFEYVPLPKKSDSQETLNARARDTVLADPVVKARWLDLAQRKPTEKNPQRTLLDKQLEDYTQKNKADYFIHKDLGGFLRRELDFYIKNEVMHLDDVQNAASFTDIEKSLRMIQCLRAIALDLIAFLAQLEDFQKKLWLKKKFVVEAHYCITLDRIFKLGEDLDAKDTTRPGVLAERDWLLAQIAANEKQIAAWIDLGLVKNAACEPVVASTDPLFAQAKTVEERLRANPFLMVDTQWFSAEFKYRLLAQLHGQDEQCDGLIVHSDNFQALQLLQERYSGLISVVYNDPPYNLGTGDFCYKDQFPHSSWMTFITTTLGKLKKLLAKDSLIGTSIDDNELIRLGLALSETFGEANKLAYAPWKAEPSGGKQKTGVRYGHEYLAIFSNGSNSGVSRDIVSVGELNLADDKGPYIKGRELRKWGDESLREDRPTQFFPVKAPDGTEVLPYRNDGREGRWRWGKNNPEMAAGLVDPKIFHWEKTPFDAGVTVNGQSERWDPFEKIRETEKQSGWTTWLDDHGTNAEGTRALKETFGYKPFDTPKPPQLLSWFFNLSARRDGIVLDCFAGSGTAAHAVITINRQHDDKRKYVLIEAGRHCERVLKPRIQKVVYSSDWKNGRPTKCDSGISHCFKYLRLESYEDTLNNLALKRPDGLLDLFDPAGKEDYLLHYMLNVESQTSLLSVEDFKKPFDYKLRIATDSAGACQTRAVDLVETFNYLLGLRVVHIDAKFELGYVLVSGRLPDGHSCLVVWRDCEKLDYEATSKLLDRHKITPNDNEYDVVYINGDHNIPTIAQATEAEGGVTRQLTLRQIEPEFIARMFTGGDA